MLIRSGCGVAGGGEYVASVGLDHLLVVWAHVRDVHLVVTGRGERCICAA